MRGLTRAEKRAEALLARPDVLMSYGRARARLSLHAPARTWLATNPDPDDVYAVLMALLYGRFLRRRPSPTAGAREQYRWDARRAAIDILFHYHRLSGEQLSAVIRTGIEHHVGQLFPMEWLRDPRVPVEVARAVAFDGYGERSHPWLAPAAVEHPGLPEVVGDDEWRGLLDRSSGQVAVALRVLGPRVSDSDAAIVFARSDAASFVSDLLAAGVVVTDDLWHVVLTTESPSAALWFAVDSGTSPERLDQLAFHPELQVRLHVVEHPNASEEARITVALLSGSSLR